MGDKRQDETGQVLRPKTADERLAIFVEAERVAHVGSWYWDLRRNRVEWSDECYRILGHEPGSVQPSEDQFYKAIHPEDLPRLLEQQQHNRDAKRSSDVDVRVVWPSGELRYVRLSGVARLNERGELIGFVGTLLDTTELRERQVMLERTQKQLMHAQKMEALGRLAAGVAHDFNNVLAVVLAVSDAMKRGGYEAKLAEEMGHAVESGVALTRQLLTLAKATPRVRAPLDLNQVVQGNVTLLRRLLGKHIQVAFDPDSELRTILGDEGKLQQVLVNLAVNARDAMPDGGTLRFDVGSVQAADGAPLVRLTVSDTGEGIAPELIEHVFEPFFTTKEHDAGTGLGLSTVYSLVSEHGGTIGVESVVGTGTTFAMLFPAAR